MAEGLQAVGLWVWRRGKKRRGWAVDGEDEKGSIPVVVEENITGFLGFLL